MNTFRPINNSSMQRTVKPKREKIEIHNTRPGSSEVPRNPMTRWDVSSIPANGIFLTKKLKNKINMPNGWRTIKSLVHKIRLHSRRGKGMAESFSREKLRHAPQKEGGSEILCDLPPVWPRLVRPTNLMSRMNGKKTHTHTACWRIPELFSPRLYPDMCALFTPPPDNTPHLTTTSYQCLIFPVIVVNSSLVRNTDTTAVKATVL